VILSIILSFLAVVGLSGCSTEAVEPVREGELLLGTTIQVVLYEDPPEGIYERVFDRVEEIEQKMSTSKEDYDTTELLEVNRNAGVRPVEVSADTFEVVQEALEYSRLTDGAFDLTIYPLVELWGIGTADAGVPPEEAIEERLELVDYRKVELDPEEQTIYLPEEGMGIDVGAIAKGYAADEARRILKESGVETALLDFGGNVLTIGEKPSGEPWVIGIQSPDEGRGRYLGTLEGGPSAVVTSGDYERYFVVDETRYHHIISSRTGYPARSGLGSVTIVSEDSIDADALATAMYVMGAEKGLRFIRDMEGIEAAFVTHEQDVYMTEGMSEVFEISNEQFTQQAWPAAQ
jgi:thiamine biosynthesis lipoprotein